MGLISIGRGYGTSAMQGIVRAGGLEQQRDQANETLDEQRSARKKSTISTGATSGAMLGAMSGWKPFAANGLTALMAPTAPTMGPTMAAANGIQGITNLAAGGGAATNAALGGSAIEGAATMATGTTPAVSSAAAASASSAGAGTAGAGTGATIGSEATAWSGPGALVGAAAGALIGWLASEFM